MAAAVLVIILIIVFAVTRGGGGDEVSPTDSTATTEPSQAPETKSPVVPPPGETPAPTETPTAAVEPPPVLKAGDDCPDTTLAVLGVTDEPSYTIGSQPKFTMVVTNIGTVSCKRDVGASVLAAYVYSLENKRLWSNLDCAPSNETLIKDIAPGEQVTTEVTWTGMGSAKDCPLPREAIGPGTYNLVVQLGNLKSAGVPFKLTEAVHGESGEAPAPGPAEPPAEPAPAPEPAPGG
ncbi:hypothetical protein MBRU_14545 [Mycolicibacterium brumae DSM 44177]|nr:hypothetical protein MBRU_14545 [Mycolicibacterium brumae DSM 44177]